jgi:type-F conjugative transfer system pilin assembly thiol-disulfide isomerase TrbB
MMIAQKLMAVLFILGFLNAQAGNSSWLTPMIQAQDERELHQPMDPKNKDNGFFNTHGLILFYGSQCPHCKQFAPVLKKWTKQHQAKVLALSFDNQALAEFPNFAPATTEWVNIAFQGKEINYPALFVVNPKTKNLYAVGFGAMSQIELDARMEQLIPKIISYEQGRRA